MNSFNRVIFTIFTGLLMCTPALAQENAIERYIIKYQAESKGIVASQIAQVNGEIMLAIDKHRLFSVDLTADDMGRLVNSDEIEFIEIDPKHFLFTETIPYGVPMVKVGNGPGLISEPLITDRKVCIIDSGFDYMHEDLQSQRITGDDEIVSGNGTVTNDTGDWWTDVMGHGTFIGGVIAAIGGNNVGVVGVNPGNKLYLHIVKVFSSPNGTNGPSFWVYGSTKIAALDQCIAAGSNIVNMSFGNQIYSQAENQAFIAASQSNILLIAAAGNSGLTQMGFQYNFPATYDAVMSVTNVDINGLVASNSTYNEATDIAAPGVNVESTLPGSNYGISIPGTSVSAAYVTGVAALVWGHYPSCTANQIRAALQNTANDVGVLNRDPYYGRGIINAKAAYDALILGCNVPPPPLQMVNGGMQTNLIGGPGAQLNYSLNVGSGAATTISAASTSNATIAIAIAKSAEVSSALKDLSFVLTGGTGNADLYVRFGAKPTTDTYDCLSNGSDSNERCDFPEPQEGKYYVMVHGASLFYGVSLVGSYADDNNPINENPIADFSLNCDYLECTFDGSTSSDSDGIITSYNWDFSDGNTSIGTTTSNSFASAGNYDVTLTVTDDAGASNSIIKTLEVTEVSINLAVRTRVIKKKSVAILNWNGATTRKVDLYVNGMFTRTTKNNGQLILRSHHKSALQTYQICNRKSTTLCSDVVTVRIN